MTITLDVVALIAQWVSLFFYTICFVPQIIENYRLKTGKGLSDFFLCAYLNGYLTLYFYIFGLHLPWAYKILAPLQGVATVILIIQHLYYDRRSNPTWLGGAYAGNVIAYIPAIGWAWHQPRTVGTVLGWISLAIMLVMFIPQVYKVYQEKSVAGFNRNFVIVLLIAALIEFSGALICHLPLQTLCMAGRGIVFMIIFLVQFFLYGKTQK